MSSNVIPSNHVLCRLSSTKVIKLKCGPKGGRKAYPILLGPCVRPHELLHFISTLHGPRMEVTLKAQYKEQPDPAVLTLTLCPASPPQCSERPEQCI